MSAVATLDLNLSAQHSLQNAKADEKIHAGSGNGANAVSGAELWAARIGFFTGGFTVASWAPLIPFVQSHLQLEPFVLGFLLLGLGVGSFVGMPLAGTLTQKLGSRNAIAISGLASCLLLILLAFMPGFYFECLALLAYGVALGCLEVSVNIYGTYLENRHKHRLMSGLHAAYSIGEVVSAAALTALFVLGFTPFGAVTGLMLILSFILLAVLRKIKNTKIETPKKEKDGKANSRFALSGSILVLAILCGVFFLAEGAMLDWSAIYLRDNAGVPQAKLGPQNVLTIGSVLILATLLALILVPTPMVAFIALFTMGLGIANLAPILISAASRNSTISSVKAITTVTTVGYGGLLAGPALIGAISSAISLQGAFLFICALLLISLVMIRQYRTVFN